MELSESDLTVAYQACAGQGLTRKLHDQANRLTSTTLATETTSYGYDGDGKRLRAGNTSIFWDIAHALPELALERDATGATLHRYAYGNELLSMRTAGQERYFHTDALGSTLNTTSATGTLEWSYGYEPYGALRRQLRHSATAADNPLRYTGAYQDPTGLYHLRARQYDPGNGRFTSTDPLAPVLSDPYVSSYVYANNLPTALIDPSGMGAVRGSSGGANQPSGFCWKCVPGALSDGVRGAPDFIWQGEIRGIIENPQQVAVAALMLVQPELIAVRAAMVLIQTERGYKVLQAIASSRYAGMIARRMIAWSKTPNGERLIGEPAYGAAQTGRLNTGPVRAGVGRHNGPIFRIAAGPRKVDFRP